MTRVAKPPIVLPFICWRISVSDSVLHVSDSEFNDTVLKAAGPVLVDYWAEWCGPCKMIAPVLDAIAEEYKGKLTVVKINIDENPLTPQRYGVRGIPTLMLFNEGEVEATKVGALSKSELAKFLDNNI
nr:thioredoxin TrxA [Methylovulum psychrotolerans]